MRFADASNLVADLPEPKTHPRRGRVLYDHIRETRPEHLLELGTARGASAIFTAAALEANGKGHLTTVDSRNFTWTDPSPPEVLQNAGLAHRVTLNREYSTYTWFLKTELERLSQRTGVVEPYYDFIFIDGPKNWTIDGLAVVLAEKMLRPGGWLLLDDLSWSYGKHVKRDHHYTTQISKLSDQERDEPHLLAVFELLVKQNPAFDTFTVQDEWWAWARKTPTRATSNGRRPDWNRLPPRLKSRARDLKRIAGKVKRRVT